MTLRRLKKQCNLVTIHLLQLEHWGLALDRQDERVETSVGLFAVDRNEIGHAQVAFGLIVVEGNAQLGEEAQDLAAVLA